LPDLRGGGAERLHVILAEEFLRRGYRVDFVLLRSEGELLEIAPAGARIVGLGARRIREGFVPLVRYLRSETPDVLLAAMWPLTAMAPIAARLSGAKPRLVVSEHSNLTQSAAVRGPSDIANRRLGRWLYGAADAVVAVSQGVKDDLVARTGVRPAQVRVIHNPARKPDPAAEGDRELLSWWKAGESAIIGVGALKPAKDYPTLIRAFARVAERRDARLLILGEGQLRPDLEQLAADLGVSDRVRLPGAVLDPYPYMREADLFVLSSAWEGFGNVIVEALAVGTPVVSTDCQSGPAEILENGRYGRLTPVGDPSALARAIELSLADPADPEPLKARAAEFSVERAADQYLALLDPEARR
jgi:glycosyltransferase involved in cell wall biosynthesis